MRNYILESVLVGLDCLLYIAPFTEKDSGTPSLMPVVRSSSPIMESRLGSGKFESGPARLCKTSWLCLLLTFVIAEKADDPPKDDGGVCDSDAEVICEFMFDEKLNGSSMRSVEYGRGPLRTIFSRLFSWACWCLILCFSVDICWRIATWGDCYHVNICKDPFINKQTYLDRLKNKRDYDCEERF